MNEYSNSFRRLEKIKATFEQLHVENLALRKRLKGREDQLVAKVRRLEEAVRSSNIQAAARERVLVSVQKELDSLKAEHGLS